MPGYYGSYKERLLSALTTVRYSWRDEVSNKYSHINDEINQKIDEFEQLYDTSELLFNDSDKKYYMVSNTVDKFIQDTEINIQRLEE